MATTSTPIAAPPAASASTPAAAPASSTPATTPATTPSSSPAASPAVTPQATPDTAMGSDASIAAMVASAEKNGFGKDLPEQVNFNKPEVPAVEKPAAEVEEPAKPAEAAAEAEEPDYSLEEDGFVGARDLAAKLDANPALKAALDAETRNEIMANARLAEVGAGYRELFSSLDEAKVVAQTAQEFAGYSESFSLVGQDRVKGTDAFVTKLIEGSALRDAEGKIVKNADGTIRTDGTAGAFFDEIGNRAIALKIINKVEASGDENLKAALDLVMESVGLRPSTAAEDQYQDPALTARKAALDAQEARMRSESEGHAREQATQHQAAVDEARSTLYEAEVGKLLGLATGLDAFTRGAVELKIEQGVREGIKNNVAYRLRLTQLEQQPRTPERRQQEVALARDYLRNNLARIARPILAEAGVAIKGKASERAQAQAARAENARSEVNGGRATQPKAPGSDQSPAQQTAQATDAFKQANGGREPSESELNIYMMLTAARAKGYAA